MPPFLVNEEIPGTPNAVLIARYCKLFGISPADELGILDGTMRMAVNWACYIAYVQSENNENEKAQDTKQYEAEAMGKFLQQLEVDKSAARS